MLQYLKYWFHQLAYLNECSINDDPQVSNNITDVRMPQIMEGIKSYKMAADKSNSNRIYATAFAGNQQPGKYTISPNQYSRKPTTVATPYCMRKRVKKTQRKSCSEKKKMHLSDLLFIDPFVGVFFLLISRVYS